MLQKLCIAFGNCDSIFFSLHLRSDQSAAVSTLSDVIGDNREVLSIEGANENYPCGLWIITSQNYHREIKKQLEDMGIGIDRIIRYVDKSEAYYEAVDDRYQELEEKEKVLRTGG